MPTNYERVQAILAERDGHAAMTRKSVALDVLTANGAAQRMTELDTKFGWSAKLRELREDSAAEVAKAEAAVAAVIAKATTPTDTDPLLTELQIGRAWNRLRLAIDKETPAGKLVAISTALASTTDPIERAALLQEGPAYLAAFEHRNPTEKLHAVLAESIPELAAAEATLHHTGMVHRITDDNAAYAERQLSNADERVGVRHDLALTDPATAAPLPAATD